MTFRLHRRTLLRGATAAGIATFGLPLLEAMLNGTGTALAGGAPLPKRLGIFYWGNGRAASGWSPTPDGAGGWLPSENLQPLVDAGLGPDVSVVTMLTAGSATGCHVPARAMILSGAYDGAGGLDPGVSSSPLPSFDQIAADHIGTTTLFPSLEIGVSTQGFGGVPDTFSCAWRGGSVLPAECSPRAFFDRVFAGFEPDDSVRTARLSVLDAVLADADALHARLGATDRVRLEQHLDGLRDLEVRVATEPPLCTVPTMPAEDAGGPEAIGARSTVMCDLVAMALACDLTRVFSFRFTQALADSVLSEVGLTDGLHNVSHTSEVQHSQAVTYTIGRYAELLSRLAALTEGEGRLLDQCAIMAMSELMVGMDHQVADIPLLVAGGCGGALHSGLLVDGAGAPACKLPFTLLQALDVPVGEMGMGEALVNTPIAELLV